MKQLVRSAGRRVVAYDVMGSGPLLVCVPGGPGYSGDQLDDLGGLSRHLTLVRVDLRGAGQSDPPSIHDWSLEAHAADLDLLRRHLGQERIDVFGHAHGGLVAAAYAHAYPDHVGRLVLDGIPVKTIEEIESGSSFTMAEYFHIFDDRAKQYLADHMVGINESALEWFWGHEAGRDFRTLVATARARTLVVSGASDPMAGASIVAVAHEMLNGTAALIPEASHFTWVEQPQAFVAAVEGFLSGSQPVVVGAGADAQPW